ncbi:MAG: hypothetical protein QOE33_2542 [Acidobacteriota bacterium]|nr:hypothetical protein [Acidobacteriota bacterium]
MKTGPELELLLACAGASRAQDFESSAARLLGSSFNPDYFLFLAERQGLLPLAYRRLRDTSSHSIVPFDQLARLKQRYTQNAARCLFLTSELCRVLDVFEGAGIDAIPYKGPALSVAAYGDATLRQFIDLDILVRPCDVKRATEMLVRLGFAPHFKLKNAREEETFLRLSYVQLFQREEDDVAIELHWNVAPRFFNFPVRIERLWEHEGRLALGGRQVRAIAPEMLVLLLCVHGNKDFWLRLEWATAIDALLSRNHDFNWAQLLIEARRYRALRVLLVGLSLANDLLDTKLPDEVTRLIAATPAIATLVETAKHTMFADATPAPTLAEQLRFHTRSKDSVRDRFKYCARLALTTTPVDWETLHLPASLSFVHALLRPLRLARKYLAPSARRAS